MTISQFRLQLLSLDIQNFIGSRLGNVTYFATAMPNTSIEYHLSESQPSVMALLATLLSLFQKLHFMQPYYFELKIHGHQYLIVMDQHLFVWSNLRLDVCSPVILQTTSLPSTPVPIKKSLSAWHTCSL